MENFHLTFDGITKITPFNVPRAFLGPTFVRMKRNNQWWDISLPVVIFFVDLDFPIAALHVESWKKIYVSQVVYSFFHASYSIQVAYSDEIEFPVVS